MHVILVLLFALFCTPAHADVKDAHGVALHGSPKYPADFKHLDYVKPDFVHVLADGKIVRSGGAERAHELEREGYRELAA